MFIIDSSFKLQLAFIKKNKIFSFINEEIQKSSDIIVQKAISLLSDANSTFQDVENITVVVGPGLFTGVRTGVLFANMLAYSLQKPIISLNVFEILSFEVFSEYKEIDAVLSLVNIGKKGAVCSFLDKNLIPILKEKYISEDDIDEFLKNVYDKYNFMKIMIVGNKQNILNININSEFFSNNHMMINSEIQSPKLSYIIKLSTFRYDKNNISSSAIPYYVGEPSISLTK